MRPLKMLKSYIAGWYSFAPTQREMPFPKAIPTNSCSRQPQRPQIQTSDGYEKAIAPVANIMPAVIVAATTSLLTHIDTVAILAPQP